jgi:hypothetical protein
MQTERKVIILVADRQARARDKRKRTILKRAADELLP